MNFWVLITISAVIAAAAAGDLMTRKRKRLNLSMGELFVVGGSMILLFAGGGTHAAIAAIREPSDQSAQDGEVAIYTPTGEMTHIVDLDEEELREVSRAAAWAVEKAARAAFFPKLQAEKTAPPRLEVEKAKAPRLEMEVY
jgi:hypothetical protein